MTKDIVRYAVIGTLALILLMFLLKIYIIVEPGERALIFNRATGNLRVTSGSGFFFLVPLIEQATLYDIKSKTYTTSVAAPGGETKGDEPLPATTADQQAVFLDLTVRFHPDDKQLTVLHQTIGADYVAKVVKPAVRSRAQLVAARFTVADLNSARRAEIQAQLETALRADLARSFIVVDEVLLRDAQFTEEYKKSLENRQLAQLKAEEMRLQLQQQELEKQRKVLEAEGEADSIRLRGKALSENPLLIQYEYIKLLAPNIQAIVTDHNAIFNFSDFMKNAGKK